MSLRKAIRFPTTICGIHFCFLGRRYETVYLSTTDEWTQVFIKWKWPYNRFWGHCSLNGENVAGFTECSGVGTKLVYCTLDDSSPNDLDGDVSVPEVHNRMTQTGTRFRGKIRWSIVNTCACGQGSLRKKKSNQLQVSLRQNYLLLGSPIIKTMGLRILRSFHK